MNAGHAAYHSGRAMHRGLLPKGTCSPSNLSIVPDGGDGRKGQPICSPRASGGIGGHARWQRIYMCDEI